MSETNLPSSPARWRGQELARIQTRADKARLRTSESRLAAVTDEALELCALLLRDVAQQHGELEAIRCDLRMERDASAHFFEALPFPCVASDHAGVITQANAAVGRLLNTAPARLVGRPLVVFFRDRPAFEVALQSANASAAPFPSFSADIRPRERRTARVDVVAVRAQPAAFFWFFHHSLVLDPRTPKRRGWETDEAAVADRGLTAQPAQPLFQDYS